MISVRKPAPRTEDLNKLAITGVLVEVRAYHIGIVLELGHPDKQRGDKPGVVNLVLCA